MRNSKIIVTMVSESEFTVQGHGVHTAYKENFDCLAKRDDVDIQANIMRTSDIVHIQTIGFYSLRHMLSKKSRKKVVSAHVLPDSFVGSFILTRYWLWIARLYLRWFYNRADLVLAVSDETKQGLINLGIKKPIEVVYNTIDTTKYIQAGGRDEIRRSLGISNDTFVVIGAGQTQPRKRIDTFIEVAKRTPNIAYIWVGSMPFKHLAAEHNHMTHMIESAPQNVHFVGQIDFKDMPKYYAASDAFMLPSEQETFGLVIVEAAAAGLPIVLRDIPDYDGTFRADALMAADDESFAQAVKHLMQDKHFYDQAKQRARHIARRFDSAAGAEQLVTLYKKVLSH